MMSAEPTLGQMAEALCRCLPIPLCPFGGYALRASLVAFLPGYRQSEDWQRQVMRLKRHWWQVIPIKKHTVVFWIADGALHRVFIDGRMAHRAAVRIPPEGGPS